MEICRKSTTFLHNFAQKYFKNPCIGYGDTTKEYRMNDTILTLGIILCVSILALGVVSFIRDLHSTPSKGTKLNGETAPAVQKRRLGLSEIHPAQLGTQIGNVPFKEPIIKTLRVSLEKLSKARWRFKIRFVFLNTTDHDITLDDIHAAVYEKLIITPPYADMDYRGEMQLLQDNSILKHNQEYSLKPGDGYEMVLVFEQTRLEGHSPQFGGTSETAGVMISLCGFFIDYYFFNGSEIVRSAIPSDTLYYFQCLGKDDPGELHEVDDTLIQKLKDMAFQSESARNIANSMKASLQRHLEMRPIPKA